MQASKKQLFKCGTGYFTGMHGEQFWFLLLQTNKSIFLGTGLFDGLLPFQPEFTPPSCLSRYPTRIAGAFLRCQQ